MNCFMRISIPLLGLAALGFGLLPAHGQTPATTLYSDPSAAPATSAATTISHAAAEVVRLGQSGLSEDVILAYIQNAQTPFDLRADAIVYLKDLGVSSGVITAMLNRDLALRGQLPSIAATAPTPAVASEPEPIISPAPENQPAPGGGPPAVYDSNPPQPVATFYDDLAPYGAWLQLSGVGWCWQPRTVVLERGWRPYCHGGHWVWTDAGWYWQSDYSWGWAPFHYGRWLLHERSGWVWIPDTVWGPAWITWRVAADHCGWAPLPPRAEFDLNLGFRFNGVRVSSSFDFGMRPEVFTFIALGDFHQHDLGQRLLAPAEVARVYHQTSIVNNYVVNHAVVNRGVAIERVTAATHRPVQKIEIRDLPAGAPRQANPRSADQAELAVYRPHLATPARTGPVAAQKVDDRHPVVRHDTPPAPNPKLHPAPPSTAPPPTPPAAGSRRALLPAGRSSTPPPSTAPSVSSMPPGKVTPLGTEVYHRETSSTLGSHPAPASQEQLRPAVVVPSPSQNPHQYSPRTPRPETDPHPAAPPAARSGNG